MEPEILTPNARYFTVGPTSGIRIAVTVTEMPQLSTYSLVGPDDRIHPLPSNRTVTIGRALINQISLDDCCVSRMHALIAPGENGPILTDCGSTNGTFVNGHTGAEIKLHHGDVIQIGKYVFLVFLGTHDEIQAWVERRRGSTKMDQTQPIDVARVRRSGPKDLVGDLAAFHMVPLLQALLEQRREGGLELRQGRQVLGHIYFANGSMVHAETERGMKGKEALFELMEIVEGQFTFSPESRSPFVSIFENPTALLIAGCQRLDERTQGSTKILS